MIPIKHCCCERGFTNPILCRVSVSNSPCFVIFFSHARLICVNCPHAHLDVLFKPQPPWGGSFCGWWVLWWFRLFYLPVSLSFTSSQDRILSLLLWLHSEAANSWADAKWFSERVSGVSIFTLRLMVSVWVWVSECVCLNDCDRIGCLKSSSVVEELLW